VPCTRRRRKTNEIHYNMADDAVTRAGRYPIIIPNEKRHVRLASIGGFAYYISDRCLETESGRLYGTYLYILLLLYRTRRVVFVPCIVWVFSCFFFFFANLSDIV